MIQHYRNKNVWITAFGLQGFSELVGSFALGSTSEGGKEGDVHQLRDGRSTGKKTRLGISPLLIQQRKKILIANSAYLPKYLLKILPRETSNFSHLQLIQDEVGTFFD